jgi:hypothetical protein
MCVIARAPDPFVHDQKETRREASSAFPYRSGRADQAYGDQVARRRRLPATWLAAALITAAVALLAPGTSFAKPELRQRLLGVSQ